MSRGSPGPPQSKGVWAIISILWVAVKELNLNYHDMDKE